MEAIKDYKELLAHEEKRLKEMSNRPYNSATRDCENRIKKLSEKIMKCEEVK